MIIGRKLIESQKLYSTGDDYLDNLLEKAFCEGYEYAQREFTQLVGNRKTGFITSSDSNKKPIPVSSLSDMGPAKKSIKDYMVKKANSNIASGKKSIKDYMITRGY